MLGEFRRDRRRAAIARDSHRVVEDASHLRVGLLRRQREMARPRERIVDDRGKPAVDVAAPVAEIPVENRRQQRMRETDRAVAVLDHARVDRRLERLDCHARAKTEVSQAVPVSATHYIDRSGKVLPQISTRRYFCMQCHVAQDAVLPLVGNSFENVDQLSKKATPTPQANKK
jgi:cytochrome c-type protein NapB